MVEILDRWIKQVCNYEILSECVPNKELHSILLDNLDKYSEEEILQLLRCLLHSYTRSLDETFRAEYKNPEYLKRSNDYGIYLQQTEYYHRLVNDFESWEGLTWVVQLIRLKPLDAIKALTLYLDSELSYMPDFRIMGINQCIDIIEEKFIKNCSGKEAVLFNLNPREFEIIIYKLYCEMGYDSELTKATRDGGFDVIARKYASDGVEKLLIECKRYKSTKLTNDKVKAFGFTVTDDKSVSRGIMFTTVKVSNQLRDIHPRINIIEMNEIIILLNSYMGYDWDKRLNKILKFN